jgi:hypothetical protein
MRLTLLAVLVIATCPIVGIAADDKSELATQMERFHKAASAQNSKEIEVLLADDYLLITRTGNTNTKSQFLERLTRGGTPQVGASVKYEPMGIRVYGNTGIVTEKEIVTESSVKLITTSVWMKDKDRWKLVLRQNTLVP